MGETESEPEPSVDQEGQGGGEVHGWCTGM